MKTSEEPELQYFHIDGVKHILPVDALEAIQNEGAVMIDVRETYEVQLEKIQHEKVLYHPMSVFTDRLPFISKDRKIILICAHGVRSVKIANLLQYQGYPLVASLDGGFEAWKKARLPFVSVLPDIGCGSHATENITLERLIDNPVNVTDNKNENDLRGIRRI